MSLLSNVLGKTLERLTEEAVKHGAPKVFEVMALSEPITGISISVLGSLLPAIVSACFESVETTARLESKLDALIEGPLVAAREMIKTAVTAHWGSKPEIAERSRLLTSASDNLMLAYGNAQKGQPELCDSIRLLQTIVHALRPEARPALNLSVTAFRGVAADASLKAQEIDYRLEHLYEEALKNSIYFDDKQRNRYLAWGLPQTRIILEGQAAALRSEAARIEKLCLLLLKIADNREIIFQRLSSKS